MLSIFAKSFMTATGNVAHSHHKAAAERLEVDRLKSRRDAAIKAHIHALRRY